MSTTVQATPAAAGTIEKRNPRNNALMYTITEPSDAELGAVMARARAALRVRREDDERVQTLKAAGVNALTRLEDNRTVPPAADGQAPLTGVCSDYADLLLDRLNGARIPGVSRVVKVSGQNHAWVTLAYRGRTLYLDATWFDGNSIDDNGYVVHTPYKDPREMTFDEDTFTNHGAHHLVDGD